VSATRKSLRTDRERTETKSANRIAVGESSRHRPPHPSSGWAAMFLRRGKKKRDGFDRQHKVLQTARDSEQGKVSLPDTSTSLPSDTGRDVDLRQVSQWHAKKLKADDDAPSARVSRWKCGCGLSLWPPPKLPRPIATHKRRTGVRDVMGKMPKTS
jgi:hypothetical protein